MQKALMVVEFEHVDGEMDRDQAWFMDMERDRKKVLSCMDTWMVLGAKQVWFMPGPV
jgi:hypothetical protein